MQIDINKNVTKVVINNSKKIVVNLRKLTATAVAIAYVTPKSKEVGKETIELQQARLIGNTLNGQPACSRKVVISDRFRRVWKKCII